MHSTHTTVFAGRDMAVVTSIWGMVVVQAMEQLHRCMGESLKYQASTWPVGTAEHFSALMKEASKVLSFLSTGYGHTSWTSWIRIVQTVRQWARLFFSWLRRLRQGEGLVALVSCGSRALLLLQYVRLCLQYQAHCRWWQQDHSI